MATFTWAGTSGSWDVATNWTGGTAGTIPGSTDSVQITAPGTYTVIAKGVTHSADTIEINSAGATFALTDALVLGTSLTIDAGVLAFDAGDIKGTGAIVNNAKVSVLATNDSVETTGLFTNNGTITLNATDKLAIANAFFNTGSVVVDGGYFAVDGTYNGSPTGTVTVTDNAHFGMGGPVVGSNTFTFGTGTSNVIDFDTAQAVAPVIAHMNAGDYLGLANANPNALSQPTFSGGTLTYVDGGNTYSFKLTGVAAGTTFVAIKDTTGIDGAHGIDLRVAPVTPVILQVGGADGIVTSQTGDQTVTGTADAGSTVTLASSGNTLGTASTDGSGNWTYTMTAANLAALGQGTGRSVSATAADADGSISAASAAFMFSVDTQAPGAPVIAQVGGADGIVSGQTGDQAATGTAAAGSTVTLASGSTALGTATADGGGNWSYTLTAANLTAIGQGSGKSLTATATDTAGNTSAASAAFAFSVDTVAPAAPVIQQVGGSDSAVGGQAGDQTVTGTAEAGSTVTLSFDGSALGTAPADGSGHWSYTLTGANLAAIGQGTGKSIGATATDAAGNPSAPSADFSFSVITAAQVDAAYAGIVRSPPDAATEQDAVNKMNAGTLTLAQLDTQLIGQVTESTVAAAITFDAFYGTLPASHGLDFLTNFANWLPTQGFSPLSVWIGLGASFADNATFGPQYGAMTRDAFVDSIYTTIFGHAPAAGAHSVLTNSLDYYKAYAGSELGGRGGLEGLMLYLAAHDPTSAYTQAATNFLTQAAGGTAQYMVPLMATYGPAHS